MKNSIEQVAVALDRALVVFDAKLRMARDAAAVALTREEELSSVIETTRDALAERGTPSSEAAVEALEELSWADVEDLLGRVDELREDLATQRRKLASVVEAAKLATRAR